MPDFRESAARALADSDPDESRSWELAANATRLLPEVEDPDLTRLRKELIESRRGMARFENLFRSAPIPIIEQDYSAVEEWMEGLRAQGVEDILEYLGNDVLAVRAIAPLIRIVAANPAAVRAVGMEVEDFIGPIDPAIVNEGAMPSWTAQLNAVWNRDPVAHASYVAETMDGQTYDAESTLAAPVIDGQPDFSRAVFTIVDVSQHRDEVTAKSQFVAQVSHEIRTPLTAIVGFAQILQDDEEMGAEDRRQMVAAIGQQAQEVTDLVEDLLVATRVEMGQIDVDLQPVDIGSQITQTLATGGTYAADVQVEMPGQVPPAIGDAARIRQVLRNLLTNAERYGGPHVSVGVTADDEWVAVEVSDDGPGLPASDWERVFEPYQRGSSASVSSASVGIGLTISRQLAELMGGSLGYERVSDRSVFRLRLHRAG